MNPNPPDVQPDNVTSSVPTSTGFVPSQVSLNSTAQQYLNQTRPWVRFLSVLVFISSGFMVLAGIGMILAGIVGGAALSRTNPVGGPAVMIVSGFFYFILAILYIAPGIFLSRYASAIKLLETTPSPEALELALKNQKSFWRFVGIITLIFLILTVVAIVIGVIFATMMASRGF
jgi:hypothetical protein